MSTAKIMKIYGCPQCGESITSSRPVTRCPACKYSMGNRRYAFDTPNSLTKQSQLVRDDTLLTQKVLELTQDETLDALNDAVLILQTLPAKKCRITDIRPLVEAGIKIGRIAKAYDHYLRAGGQHVPSLFITNTKNKTKTNKLQENRDDDGKPRPPSSTEKPT